MPLKKQTSLKEIVAVELMVDENLKLNPKPSGATIALHNHVHVQDHTRIEYLFVLTMKPKPKMNLMHLSGDQ